MRSPIACPVCGTPEAALVYSGDHRAIDTVVIQGQTVLECGILTKGDEDAILAQARCMAADLLRHIRQET